jgi:UDPglucose--hexose-1-phosphate uridylyltransferase
LRAELEEKLRVVARTDSLVAFCPFASRLPGLIRIAPVTHQPHFEALTDASLDQLASFLWRALCWVDKVFPGKAFNYVLSTCPPGSKQPEAFQWSLDLFPRLSKTAGFEWGSNCMINALLPEAAASRYRDVARQNDPRRVLAVH